MGKLNEAFRTINIYWLITRLILFIIGGYLIIYRTSKIMGFIGLGLIAIAVFVVNVSKNKEDE